MIAGVFARKMHSTTKFAMTVLIKCACGSMTNMTVTSQTATGYKNICWQRPYSPSFANHENSTEPEVPLPAIPLPPRPKSLSCDGSIRQFPNQFALTSLSLTSLTLLPPWTITAAAWLGEAYRSKETPRKVRRWLVPTSSAWWIFLGFNLWVSEWCVVWLPSPTAGAGLEQTPLSC